MPRRLNRDEEKIRDHVYWTATAMRWHDTGVEDERWIGEEIVSHAALNRRLALRMAGKLMEQHIDAAGGDHALQVTIAPPKVPAVAADEFRVFEIAPQVVKRAEHLGIDGDVKARVREMARYSAPYSDGSRFNKRFEGFLFRIKNDTVIEIDRCGDDRHEG